MKKVYCLTTLLLCLFNFSNSYAACCDNDMRCCRSDYEIGLDLLVLKPCVDDLRLCGTVNSEVVDEIETITLKFNEICPSWEMGIRAWFKYPDLFCWCDMGFKASYTYLDHSDKSSGFADEHSCLSPFPGISEAVLENLTHDSRYESLYQELDGLIYVDCGCGDCHSLEPYFGLAFLYIKQKLDMDIELTEDSVTATDTMHWTSEAGGVGLRIGMAYNYYYSKCLTYYAFGQGTILASKQEDKQEHSFRGLADIDLTIESKGCWGCIPGFHLGTGMIYDFCVCDFELSFRIGYEFRKWYGLRKHRRFFGDDLDSELSQTSDNTRSFGLQGLNVGFGWCF